MSQGISDVQDVCQSRVRQVFEFLKALNEHRNPVVRQVTEHPWNLWLDDLPAHPSIEFQSRNTEFDSGGEGVEDTSLGALLRVERPHLTNAPTPPTVIREWLHSGWEEPERAPEVVESREEKRPNGESITERFDGKAERIAAKNLWLREWQQWAAKERPARQAQKVFEKLYSLHAQLQRESERFDLVIGDGLLSWQQPEGSIYHPLMLQRVQLEFDPLKPEFTVIDAEFGSELYTSIFHSNSVLDPQKLRQSRDQFDAAGYHPLSEEAAQFLMGFSHLLSPHGEYIPIDRPARGAENPTIGRAPVLFLRNRSKGFGAAIDRILVSLRERVEFPEAIRNIVGCESANPNGEISDNELLGELTVRDVLFGKEANPEQLRIAHAIDRHSAVLVQGPPGTGKSHTIANLIGHLLAHGHSVLVTSHTTKALRVLRGHLVKKLQPLCVSVLESDVESRSQLEQAVNEISARLSDSDVRVLRREAADLAQERSRIIDELERIRNELLNARNDEYRDIVFAGEAIKPVEAAKLVAAGIGVHDWIPGPVAVGEPCPFSADHAIELYGTNEATSTQDDQYVDHAIPDPALLPDPDTFESWIRTIADLGSSAAFSPDLWPGVRVAGDQIPVWIQKLREVIGGFEEAIGEFQSFNEWQLEAVSAGRTDQLSGCPWEHLLGKIEETARIADAAKLDAVKVRPEIVSDLPLEQQRELAETIHSHLKRGSRLSSLSLLFRPSWKRALAGWKTLGQTPAKASELGAVVRLIRLKLARQELALLWDGLIGKWGGPACSELGDEPEYSARQFGEPIRSARNWWGGKWRPLEDSLRELGFDWRHWHSSVALPADLSRNGELKRAIRGVEERLIDELRGAMNRFESLRIQGSLAQLARRLEEFNRPEAADLRLAIVQRDATQYGQAYQRLLGAVQRRDAAIRRKTLLARLERKMPAGAAVAPMWALAIRRREGTNGNNSPPSDVEKAWQWRQLNDELDRRSQVDLAQLGERIEQLQGRLREVTNELIDRQAWGAQLDRITLSQRQALVGWLLLIKKIGKGFGKRVPELRHEAQRCMGDCRDAVPVWVMPLSRVAENFDLSEPRFDVAIIDEASQCDVMALLAFMAARKVIIVGDDKQVSPLAVGQNLSVITALINQYLDGIRLSKLYDGETSVYDLALASFPAPICLLEHFRCMPDIIEFSNSLSYEGRIKPLREPSSSPLSPHIVPHRIESRSGSKNNVNRDEAIFISSLVAAVVEHKEYGNCTIGVISLVGDEQAREIDFMLRQQLPAEEYEKRRIICGNSAHFQGDERDVMFLSVVDAPADGPLSMRSSKPFQQRFNVAASRARNQMWVVYSVDPALDLKPGDLRRKLIEHAIDPKAVTRNLERSLARTQSPFEKEVLERLVRAGYRVTPQWPVGRYRIDLVVEGGRERLAIECDGDRYHTIEKLGEDMERQAILERLKWRFLRIRGSVFYRDKQGTIDRVFQKLEEMGIPPVGISATGENNGTDENALVSSVIRRAAELRAEWGTDNSEEPQSRLF